MQTPRHRLLAPLLLFPWLATVSVDAAQPVFVEFFDAGGTRIDGPVRLHGLEGAIAAESFLHSWLAPLDARTGQPSGPGRPDRLLLKVPVARLTQSVLRELRNQAGFSRVVFHLFREGGAALEEFYRITFSRVQVLDVRLDQGDLQQGGDLPPAERSAGELSLTVALIFDTAQQQHLGDVRQLLYVRGDLNGDLRLDISDPIKLLGYLFVGDQVLCPLAGDLNGDSILDLSDAIYGLNYLFNNGRPIPGPFPDCGELPAGAAIPCSETACPGPGA